MLGRIRQNYIYGVRSGFKIFLFQPTFKHCNFETALRICTATVVAFISCCCVLKNNIYVMCIVKPSSHLFIHSFFYLFLHLKLEINSVLQSIIIFVDRQ